MVQEATIPLSTRLFSAEKVLESHLPSKSTNLYLPLSAPDPGVDALALWDDNGNGRITCAEARAHGIAPVRRGHPAYEYMNDADGDGIVCE